MWLLSKIKQVIMVSKPGVVTLKYPLSQDLHQKTLEVHLTGIIKCIGCGGCANHCPARTILVRDICQEIRLMVYDGSRCTYCGRCADVCPEKAITMTDRYELATDDRADLNETMELFMLTCQRCGRCYDMENKNMIDRMDLQGYRYDNIEARAFIRKTTDRFDPEMLAKTKNYKRPSKIGE